MAPNRPRALAAPMPQTANVTGLARSLARCSCSPLPGNNHKHKHTAAARDACCCSSSLNLLSFFPTLSFSPFLLSQCGRGYSGADGGDDCAACLPHLYKDVWGSSDCVFCPNHTISPEGSTSLANCICNLGYTAPSNGQACGACITGTYKPVNGTAPCSLCLAGKYSVETARIAESACDNCPAHTYSGDGSGLLTNCTCHKGYSGSDGVACTACAQGSYKPTNGSAACSLCAQGKYSNKNGESYESACTACPMHTYSGDGSGLRTNCSCNLGYTGPDGSECSECLAGSYKDVNGSAPCSLCSPGKFLNSTANVEESSCVLCAPGTYSNVTGAHNSSVCDLCPNTTLSPAGSTQESDCV